MPDIISNTSCMVVSDNCNMFFILKNIYGEIYAPKKSSGLIPASLKIALNVPSGISPG